MNIDPDLTLDPPRPAPMVAPLPVPAPPSMVTSLQSLPRAFWVKWAGTLLNRIGTFVLPFLTLYMQGRGFSTHQAGWALAALGAGSLLAAMLGGWLADRVGRRETIALSLLGSALSLLLLGTVTSLPAVLGCCLLHGLLADTMIPAGHAMVADLVPPEHRLAAYTADRLAINLGFALGPMIAGFVIEKSFWSLFVADAATSLAYAVIALLWLPRSAVLRSETPAVPRPGVWREAFQSRPLVSYLIALTVLAAVFRQFTGALPLQMAAAGCRPSGMGFIYMINGLLIVLMEIPLTHLTRRWPLRGTIARGALIIGAGFALNGLGVSVALVVTSMTVLTIGEMLAFARTGTYLASLAPADRRGRYAGLNSLAWCTGGIAGSTFGLSLYEVNREAMWLVCGLCGLLAAAILHSPWRWPVRRKHAEPEAVSTSP